jgi:diadenosine tetraphosphate (Ap4A) HIT family hydrolase
MENCLFCKIVRKEIPATIVHEDDTTLAFLDIHPVTEGHTLLIPKEHHPWMQETPDALVGETFIQASKLMQKMKERTLMRFCGSKSRWYRCAPFPCAFNSTENFRQLA